MTQCSLSWTTKNPTLCPMCLEVITNDNIVFVEAVAFCPLCALPDSDCERDRCLRVFFQALASDHWATFRRLHFFTPSRRPRKPLQLVRRNDADDWLLDPDTDYAYPDLWAACAEPEPVEDNNPVGGGSPV